MQSSTHTLKSSFLPKPKPKPSLSIQHTSLISSMQQNLTANTTSRRREFKNAGEPERRRPCLGDKSEAPEEKKPQKSCSDREEPTGGGETGVQGCSAAVPAAPAAEDTGRERLKRHRVEVAGRVWIPDIWGQEDLLKDWTDCCGFDASLMNSNIMSAREALMAEGRRATSSRLRIENSC